MDFAGSDEKLTLSCDSLVSAMICLLMKSRISETSSVPAGEDVVRTVEVDK